MRLPKCLCKFIYWFSGLNFILPMLLFPRCILAAPALSERANGTIFFSSLSYGNVETHQRSQRWSYPKEQSRRKNIGPSTSKRQRILRALIKSTVEKLGSSQGVSVPTERNWGTRCRESTRSPNSQKSMSQSRSPKGLHRYRNQNGWRASSRPGLRHEVDRLF